MSEFSCLDSQTRQRTCVQEAFDRHADVYDERFSRQILGESIRAEVWRIADAEFASAKRVLDLGSGTGEDAIHLAMRGIHVTAVDISPRMINRLQAKAFQAGIAAKIDGVLAEMNCYTPAGADFDGIISNFGAVNCTSDLSWLRELAWRILKPGAPIILTSMGRFYPLETVILLLKRQFRNAFRRLQPHCEVSVEGVTVPVHYHSLKAIRKTLGAQFHLEQVMGLRAFLPVPGWEHLGRSALFRSLIPLDRIWCRWRLTAPQADHFVTVWRYQP